MKVPVGIELLPSAPASEIVKQLKSARDSLFNARGRGGTQHDLVEEYQRWSNRAAESLGFVLTGDSVEHLLLTRRHWLLQGWSSESIGGDASNLVMVEMEDRLRLLERIIPQFEAIQARAEAIQEPIYAPDTNFFLHNDHAFTEVNWLALNGETHDAATVLVPSVVVRELDRHKRSGKNIKVSDTNPQALRTRARISLRSLRELFKGDPTAPAILIPGVQIELVQQSASHHLNDDPDWVIINQLTTVQSLIHKPISLVTGDRSMEFSARADGLRTASIPEPESDEAPTKTADARNTSGSSRPLTGP